MLKYKIPQIVTLTQEIFELSQLKENEQICIVMNKKEVHRALRHTFFCL